MPLIIDGYNLLHATTIVGRRAGLEASRTALLDFLAESIDPAEISRTTVVFDAAEAPPGLPREEDYRGITVRFASGHADADSLIEELIAADHSPRSLVVVSSDHRLQRAARRRRARAVDSDEWFTNLVRSRKGREPGPSATRKKDPPRTAAEVEYWLELFGGDAADDEGHDEIFPPGYGEDVEEQPE